MVSVLKQGQQNTRTLMLWNVQGDIETQADLICWTASIRMAFTWRRFQDAAVYLWCERIHLPSLMQWFLRLATNYKPCCNPQNECTNGKEKLGFNHTLGVCIVFIGLASDHFFQTRRIFQRLIASIIRTSKPWISLDSGCESWVYPRRFKTLT
jgi:hypothetical protein